MADRTLQLKVILAGLDRLTSPLKGITGASSAARRDLAQTQKQIRDLDAAQQKIGRFKAKETALAGDAAAYAQSQAKLEALRAQLDATAEPTKKLRNEFERVERQTATMATKLDVGGNQLQELSRDLASAGVDVGDLARHENRLTSEADQATAALRRQTEQLDKVNAISARSAKLQQTAGSATAAGVGMTAAGVAIGAGVGYVTKQAMTLESAMADVRKVVDFPTPESFAKMSNDILDISTRVPMAAEGIAQIVASAGRANVPREELLKFAEDAAKMGVAFDSTAEVAGETMAKWRTAFELPQSGVIDLADQINALTNKYGGNVAAVTEMVTKIGPLGKVGGLAAAQIAGMGQVLSSVGVESDVGATGIKNMMLALTKGTSATKSQSEAFKALGLDAVDVSKNMQKDAGAAILDVMTRLQKLPKEAQAGALTQLFGSESVGAIAPMLTSLDQLRTNFGMVGDRAQFAGSMTKEYLSAIATTEGATGLAGNALSAMNITLGQYLLPTVRQVSEFIVSAAGSVRDWADEHPALAKGIMLFMAIGAGLLVLLGTLAMGFGAAAMAASVLMATLGIGLGPLLLIVAAIAAVAAAVYMIYDNWGAIVGWLAGLWETIKQGAIAGINALVQAFLSFTPLGLLIGAFAPAMAWLRTLNFSQIGADLINGLVNGILGRLGALKATVQNAGSAVATWFKDRLGIRSPSRVFAQLGGFVMEGLDNGLAASAAAPMARISGIAAGMTGALAAGAIGPAALAAAPVAAPGAQVATAAAGGASHYAITINAGAGSSPHDIEAAVRRAIEGIEREKRGRSFSDEGY